MGGRIVDVIAGSICDELGIEPGDILIAINGEAVRDLIEYNYHSQDEFLELTVEKADGELWDCDVEKFPEEELGLVFESDVFDGIRTCRNKCIFCFVDQQPPKHRPSMMLKDDDYRMSFLEGNYITCTNMNEADYRRIGEMHLSPLYVSVHCVDPLLRQHMLGLRKPAEILLTLQRLISLGCVLHTQIVLCPGINDGEALAETLDSLYALAGKSGAPGIETVAIVPVGITAFQKHPELRAFTREEAASVIDDVERRQQQAMAELSRSFVFASDEMYLLAGRDFPPAASYGEFDQLENGVGMAAQFLQQCEEAASNLPAAPPSDKLAILTGESGEKVIQPLVQKLRASGVDVQLRAVKNLWFGGGVTVTGLVTGSDIAAAVQPHEFDRIFLPSNMLKFDEDVFLDDMTVAQLSQALATQICIYDPNPSSLITAVYWKKRSDKKKN